MDGAFVDACSIESQTIEAENLDVHSNAEWVGRQRTGEGAGRGAE